MSATVLSGKELATAIRTETAAKAAELTAAGTPPKLAVVVPTADESSAHLGEELLQLLVRVEDSVARQPAGRQTRKCAGRTVLRSASGRRVGNESRASMRYSLTWPSAASAALRRCSSASASSRC